jgi:hypothetical protein
MFTLKNAIISFLFIFLLAGAGLAQQISPAEIKRGEQQVIKLQKEMDKLKNRLARTKNKQQKNALLDKIDSYQKQIIGLKKKLKPKPVFIPTVATPEVITEEAASPEAEEEITVERYKRFHFEAGGAAGFFGGVTAYLAEARLPLKIILGPTTTSLRFSAGLAQNRDASHRYAPLNLDLLFNFPPGWFTGTNNYIGAGLNYIWLTTGRVAGGMGAELIYGVESDGFGGIVFGELGYATIHPGNSPDNTGITALFGYRQSLGF